MRTGKPAPPPAFCITFDGPVTLFGINDEAFDKWIAESDPEDCYWSLPSRLSESPSADLSRLVDEATENGVINSDERLELQLCGDEDADSSGFWVFVANRRGKDGERQIPLLAGWSEVEYPSEGAAFAAATRDQLEHVLSHANSILPQA
ncbi:Uncharacterised protein [Mycobacteroides abscessus subsp. massiliense]|uniref:hypothetical protein n=1 Tax=Mycobacteroides abscessus TaxID=36809 RepID=UPI0009A7EB97|nr:hypothetical protein [Mycobacteroides abscessus]SLE99869.1 Uncharacterised protein [Mycobacteroides abscessus subsp. massiliense]